MGLEATQSLQCLKAKGFKATQSLHRCKNDCFAEIKNLKIAGFFKGYRAKKSLYR